MEECIIRVPPVMFQRRYRLDNKPEILLDVDYFPHWQGEARVQHRRAFLQFWQRARRRHIDARMSWQDKLNRFMSP